jgi:hypothetical protein
MTARAEINRFVQGVSMNQIAAPANITANGPERTGTIGGPSLFANVIRSVIRTLMRKEEDHIAKRYEGFSWCDQTERDLNYDAIAGRQTKRP